MASIFFSKEPKTTTVTKHRNIFIALLPTRTESHANNIQKKARITHIHTHTLTLYKKKSIFPSSNQIIEKVVNFSRSIFFILSHQCIEIAHI